MEEMQEMHVRSRSLAGCSSWVAESQTWLSDWACLLRSRRCGFDPLGWEDPLEKEMATHFSILAWRMPWTEEFYRLHSTELRRVRHNWLTHLLTYMLAKGEPAYGRRKQCISIPGAFKCWVCPQITLLLFQWPRAVMEHTHIKFICYNHPPLKGTPNYFLLHTSQ